MKKGAFLAALGVLASTSMAGLVTFDNDATGFSIPNGFQSVDSSNLSFYDSDGEDLYLIPFDEFGGSNGLAVNFDGFYDDFDDYSDTSFLIVKSAIKLMSFGLDIGADYPEFTQNGDFWEMRAFDGDSLVGTSTVTMNRNGLGDQTISFSLASGFDRIEVEAFTSPTPLNDEFGTVWTSLQEVVDNVTYEPVPEPGTIAALGLGVAAAARRRRKS